MEKEGGRDIKKISQHLLDRRSHPRLIFERLLDPEKAFSMGYQKADCVHRARRNAAPSPSTGHSNTRI